MGKWQTPQAPDGGAAYVRRGRSPSPSTASTGRIRILLVAVQRLDRRERAGDVLAPVEVRMDHDDLAALRDHVGRAAGHLVVALAVEVERHVERLDRRRGSAGDRELSGTFLPGKLGQ